jgi:hypothetical protein
MANIEETPAQKSARIRRQKREAKINVNAQERLDKITQLSGRTPESSELSLLGYLSTFNPAHLKQCAVKQLYIPQAKRHLHLAQQQVAPKPFHLLWRRPMPKQPTPSKHDYKKNIFVSLWEVPDRRQMVLARMLRHRTIL